MDLFFKLGKASDNVADVGTSVVKSTNNASENAMNVALNKRFLNQLDTVGDQLDNVGDHLDNIPLPGGRPPRLGVSDVPDPIKKNKKVSIPVPKKAKQLRKAKAKKALVEMNRLF